MLKLKQECSQRERERERAFSSHHRQRWGGSPEILEPNGTFFEKHALEAKSKINQRVVEIRS